MKILYYSTTGNNLHIAKSLGGERFSIPKCIKEGQLQFEDEVIGLIFPCYYLGVPRIVQRFIKKASLKAKYIFVIISYGSFSGGAMGQMLTLSRKNGLKIDYINQISMVDNYIPMFDMDKQIKSEPKRRIEEHLKRIIDDIHHQKKMIRGVFSPARLLTAAFKPYYNHNLRKIEGKFTVEEHCSGCGLCEKACPVDNIHVNGEPVYQGHCEECFACTHLCPKNAIRVRGERSKARFINQHVSRSEIIDGH